MKEHNISTSIRRSYSLVVIALICCLSVKVCMADDTSSGYLGGNRRTGYIDTRIPKQPVLQWIYHEKHPPRHAWREPNREVQYIDFDYATQVAIGNEAVFFGSSADHKVYALDLTTGTEKWTFYTEGPVRFTPVIRHNRLYVVSDDGYLYCLDSQTGKEIWTFRGGPGDDKLIGNDQMISHWPARSGVLIEGNELFFTAGMWSRDGVFIYCLDVDNGDVIWRNDTSGYHFATLPHSTGYAGVAPQGYLALNRGRLYVPTGRGAPAAFDAKTGAFLWYENGHGYKPHQPGGSRVMAWRDWIIFKRRSQHAEEAVRYEQRDPAPGAASGLYALDFRTGEPRWSLTDRNIVAARGNKLMLAGQGPVIKVDIDQLLKEYAKYWKDGKNLGHDGNIPNAGVEYTRSGPGKLIPKPAWMSPLPLAQWQADVGRVFVLLCAGDTILTGGRGQISAIDFNTGKILWKKSVDGEARGICCIKDNFVVSTTAGKLYCFGHSDTDANRQITHKIVKPRINVKIRQQATDILEHSNIGAGYALMLGAGDGQLLTSLIEQSDLLVYCLEPDSGKVAHIQKQLDHAGLLGIRAAIHHGSFERLPYNPYFANLIVWGDSIGSDSKKINAKELYRVLRPCGGVACQLTSDETFEETRRFLKDGGVPIAEISNPPLGTMIRRGKLPGTGEWTHAHANIGRTGSSEDSVVRLPLGMLWWGGPGPARIVSRHWRAPVPVFANGILYIQGQHDVFAVDAYNGREMWNRHLENVGRFPPTHRGGNIVTDDDGAYCIQGLKCLKLDAQTGKTIKEYRFIVSDTHKQVMATLVMGASLQTDTIVWEYLGIIDNYLLGTLGYEREPESKGLPYTKTIQQSKILFAIDKTTGEQLWEHQLTRSVSPTAVVADAQTVYLLDRTGGELYEQFLRRGTGVPPVSTLKALDLATGKIHWEQEGIPSAWKTLMLSNDVIVAYPNPAENAARDGDKGVGVYSCADGKVIWSQEKLPGISETGRGGTMRHSFIVGDKLFLPWAYDLRTGKEQLLEEDPLTGQQKRFDVSGKNFCGTIAAAKDLLIYRSASMGFTSISRDSGSYWLPESRPSCWISAIPVGGMVLAPEGYSTCICPYNYKTSLALIPVERNENWSVYLAGGRREKMAAKDARNKVKEKDSKVPSSLDKQGVETVSTLRVNFNAPGDQMDTEGKLWMAWPRPVDPKKVYIIRQVPIQVDTKWTGFRFNSDYHTIINTKKPWLFTSGLKGPLKFKIPLSDGRSAKYNVVLYFVETEVKAPERRIFDVKIQGKTVISHLDIAKATGGTNRALVKEISNIEAKGAMSIELIPLSASTPLICSLEIIEQKK